MTMNGEKTEVIETDGGEDGAGEDGGGEDRNKQVGIRSKGVCNASQRR